MDQKDKWPNDVVLKTLFIFFAFNPVTVFYSKGRRTLQQ
jgi:hypothetical protein